jgi:hypothetical protein
MILKAFRWGSTVSTIMAVLAVVPPVASQDALPPAEELIDRHIEAMGGRDTLLGHASSRSTGTFSMPAAGITGTLVVEAAAPNRMASQVEIPGLGLIRNGFDGKVGWSVDPNLGPRLLDGLELAAMQENTHQLAALRDPSLFTVRETVELTEMNGQPCYRVRLVWNSGRETFDCYSVETGLMVAMSASQETPMGNIESVTFLEEYQEYGGILSPTRIRQQALGQEQLMTLDSIEYDVVEDDAFDPPASIRTLMEAAGPNDPD